MKKSSSVIAILGLLVVCVYVSSELLKAQRQINTSERQEASDKATGSYALRAMELVHYKGSETKKQLTAQMVVRVTNSVFEKEEHKQAFILLLAIESRFNQFNEKGQILTSSTGAKGIGQVMEKFAPEFAKLAGIEDFKTTDINDPEINMILGATLLRSLIETFNGNIPEALIAYNAGKQSLSLKQLQSMSEITHPEPANYVTRWSFLKFKMDQQAEAAVAELKSNK